MSNPRVLIVHESGRVQKIICDGRIDAVLMEVDRSATDSEGEVMMAGVAVEEVTMAEMSEKLRPAQDLDS